MPDFGMDCGTVTGVTGAMARSLWKEGSRLRMASRKVRSWKMPNGLEIGCSRGAAVCWISSLGGFPIVIGDQ